MIKNLFIQSVNNFAVVVVFVVDSDGDDHVLIVKQSSSCSVAHKGKSNNINKMFTLVVTHLHWKN